MEKIPRTNQNGFRGNQSTISQILTIRRIIEEIRAKNLESTLLFIDLPKAFDSIDKGKLEQILLAYILPTETDTAITMLYKDMKSMVRSPNCDTDFFDIVLQADTVAPFLFMICFDYVQQTSKGLKKGNSYSLK